MGFHVEALNYFYAKEHQLIGLGDYRNLNLQNIGEHGKNLTIAVLSMNRSSLTKSETQRMGFVIFQHVEFSYLAHSNL